MKVKTAVRFHLIPTRRMAKIKKTYNNQMLSKDEGNQNSHTLLMGVQHGITTLENYLAVSYKVKYTLSI